MPELISVNEKIQKDLTNINKYISDFIFKNNEILFATQGPPGTGKTTLSVSADLVQKVIKSQLHLIVIK